ncbi:hypothetical protein [Paludibacter jiangxiensis]|uniref:Uncharacterized protein n=1 Tax=Paludibacter jiangxiensis TaxID=681398 RepID=A0A171ABH0_9BACT|nr:hypothetical protein [Paludibacter jiangxiensis]GAT63481.1 hypothetical protein PJIAN_418 [Paludibacter jiangxiensis]
MERYKTTSDLSNKNLRLTLILGGAIVIIVILLVILMSGDDKEPAVKNLDKTHAIAVTYETKQLSDSTVLLIENQNIYIKGKLIKSIARMDTLPALGDSIQAVEDNDDSQTMARIPKEYEFFVTIK